MQPEMEGRRKQKFGRDNWWENYIKRKLIDEMKHGCYSLLTGEVLQGLLDLAARHDGLHGVHPDVLLQLLPERAQQHQVLRLHHHACRGRRTSQLDGIGNLDACVHDA